MGEVMDRLDQKLLEMLTENSRLSNAELARELGVSRTTVREKIMSLVERGVIEKFTITINPVKAGKTISAAFDIDVEPGRLMEIAAVLSQNADVTNVYQMTGPSTLHLHALLRDGDHLERFIREKLYSLPGIISVRTNIILTRFKNRVGLRV